MFEFRCFQLGKVECLFLGQGLLWAFLRFWVAALGIFLLIYIRWEPRIRLAEGNRTSQTLHLN